MDIESKINAIVDFNSKNGFKHDDNDLATYDEDVINKIYEIIINGNVAEKYDEPLFNNVAAFYFRAQNDIVRAEKYYLIGVEQGSVKSMFNLAALYSLQQNYELTEKYCLMAIECKCSKAMHFLASMYNSHQRYEDAAKYYKMASEHGDHEVLVSLARVYCKLKDYTEAEHCLLQAADEHKNINAMIQLANLYRTTIRNKEKVEKYLLMVIEANPNNVVALNNLALLYKKLKKKKLAEQYYIKAVELGYDTAMFNLARLYESHDQAECEKYYLMAIEHGNMDALQRFIKVCGDNSLKLYHCLTKIPNPNDDVLHEMKALQKTYDVKCFVNKIKKGSLTADCPICFDENVIVIPRECMHYFCKDCFVKLEKCPICDNDRDSYSASSSS